MYGVLLQLWVEAGYVSGRQLFNVPPPFSIIIGGSFYTSDVLTVLQLRIAALMSDALH